MPSISVIIPAYNASIYLAQTIDSVLAQTVQDWELVIVDDGSSDETCAVAEQYAIRDGRIRVICQDNCGTSHARNRGLAETTPTSDYVVFLDADDVWEADALENLLRTLAIHPEAVAAHGLVQTMNELGESPCQHDPGDRRAIVGTRPAQWTVDAPTTFAVLVLANVIVTPGTCLVRREALQQIDGFDPALPPAEDWDMWIRLSAKGDIAFVPTVVLRYRIHGNGVSRNKRRMHQAQLRVYRKLVCSAELSSEQRHLLSLGYRWFHRTNARNRWTWAKEASVRGRWIEAAKHVRHALIDTIQSHGRSHVPES